MQKVREQIGVLSVVNPQTITANTNSPALVLSTQRRAAALVLIGAVTGTNAIIVRIQSSPDGTNWSNVVGKSVTVSSPANKQVLLEVAGEEIPNNHDRVRYQIDLNGNTNATVAGVFLAGDYRYYPSAHASTLTAEG